MKIFKMTGVLIMSLAVLMSAGCKGNEKVNNGEEYKVPDKLMTPDEYKSRVDELANYTNFSVADAEYIEKIDTLRNDLFDMIYYNSDENTPAHTGKTYYVSNEGDDSNDGLTEKTPWATLDKVNSADFEEGDAVLFCRGDLFRGRIACMNGVTYAAYGSGPKPKIYNSVDGKTYGKWVKTDTENVWVLDKNYIECDDIGVVVFNVDVNFGEFYAEKKNSLSDLKENFDFFYNGPLVKGGFDNKLYLYYDGGNPAESFDSIEISGNKISFMIPNGTHDVTVHNLDLRYGMSNVFASKTKNITFSYCLTSFTGGAYTSNETRVRYGGALTGCWEGCDNMVTDFCYIYQQFDSGVTPQFHMAENDTPVIFNKFITSNCLIEKCEYSFEFFLSCNNQPDSMFKDCYFGYNLCRQGGLGFGDKASASAYVKSWQSHTNRSENCMIEKNIFDRAASNTLDIGAKNQDGTRSYENLFGMQSNIYIQKRNKSFAQINDIKYKYNEETYSEIENLGIEKDSVFMFTE